jgi:hypothetical protein
MVFYSLEDAHEYIDSGEANKTPKHIVELYRRGMMAKGGNVGSEDIYKLAEEMSEKDFRNKFLTLSKSEKDNVESLIRLGDDKKLALITILDKRYEPNNDDFYRQAYHYKGGGNVGKKDITITTYEKVVEESYGFSKIQIKNIKFIIKKIINLLSGQIESLSSGGGNAHIFVQLKDNTWIGFHNEFGDITISSPFQTFKKLTDAWNSDDWKKVTGRSLKNYKSKETFGNLVQIVSDIQDKNYDNLYKAGGDVEDEKVYIDLFEDYENIPANVQIILDEYSESFEDGDYIGMSKAQDELEQIGYTFNFYVDGDAYGLRPIGIKLSQLKGYEDADEE